MTPSKALEKVLNLDLDAAEICVCLASSKGRDSAPNLAVLNMSKELNDQFKNVVRKLRDRMRQDHSDGNLVLRPYDAGYKPEAHEIEWVESTTIQEISQMLKCIPDPVANSQLFTAKDDFINGLNFYVIVVELPGEDRTLYFRKYDPKKELGRSKWFAALFSDGQYDTVRETTFLFDDEIDCFAQGKYIFSRRKNDFQHIFGFFAKLREKAHECLGIISERVPIAGFAAFAESCESHLLKLAKLKNIAGKPYLQTVTMSDLKKTIKKFNLNVKIVKEDGIEKLQFNPADRWVILKLLDDDFLGSVMTKLQYEVNSKRQVEGA